MNVKKCKKAFGGRELNPEFLLNTAKGPTSENRMHWPYVTYKRNVESYGLPTPRINYHGEKIKGSSHIQSFSN